MTNLLFGILTTALCAAAFFLAWRAARREDYRLALLLILTGGLLLRIYAATDLFLHEWDERYHALVARNLMEHPLRPTLYDNPILPYNYEDWSSNHIWLHKQPMALWAMALSLKLFGISEIALRLPSILLSTLAVWLTYGIARYYTDQKTALLAAFLHAIHGLVIALTAGRAATDHPDLFFLFFIELGVFFSIRFLRAPRWYMSILIGLSIGLGVLTKWLPAFIVVAVWGLLVLNRLNWAKVFLATSLALGKSGKSERGPSSCLGRVKSRKGFGQSATSSPSEVSNLRWVDGFLHLALIVSVAVAVFLPWQLYIFRAFPQEAAHEQAYNLLHFFEGLEGHGEPWYYHLDRMRIIFGEFIYLPLAWLTYKRLRQLFRRRIADWSLLAWIWIPLIVFSLAHTKMQAYTIISAPAYFILTALFFRYLNIYKRRLRIPLFATNLALALLVLLPVRYSIERVKPFSIRERSPEWAENMKALNERYEMDERTVVFGVERPIEFMFYTGATAYPLMPEAEAADSLSGAGYGVYRYAEGKLIGL